MGGIRRTRGGTAPLDRAALTQLHDYLAARGRLHYPSGNCRHVHQSACIFVRFLEVIGAVQPKAVPVVKASALFVEFIAWMASHRGTRESTLASYRLPVERLLGSLGQPDTYSAQRLRAFFLLFSRSTRPNLMDAIREGAVLRVRPKAMTVAVIIGGLVPIMMGSGTGSEVMQRIAAPMVGGMISAPLLSMFGVPAVYIMLCRARLRRRAP